MAQNRSSAVMQQRVEPHDSLDFFPTPAFATRALCEWLTEHAEPIHNHAVWEPACGQGHMSRPLGEYFGRVISTDVHDYGFGKQLDYLFPIPSVTVDWVITNPPFRLGAQFIERALVDATEGVAMLVRSAFLESADRYDTLFHAAPPSDILQFVERVPMFKGKIDRTGSTATAYCWLVWLKGSAPGTRFHWLAPCRKRLERDEDYA